MTGPHSERGVRLHRDALTTPWGFRLQGGKDFKQPLTVQRVFVGSPADGELNRGDVLLGVDNYDATQMMHKQAMDVIKSAGGSLSLTIRRGVQRPRSHSPPSVSQMAGQHGPSYGVDYSQPSYGFQPHRQPESGSMLGRVQHTLDRSIWSPGGETDEFGEPQRSVRDLKQDFNSVPSASQAVHGRPRSRHVQQQWQKPDGHSVAAGLRDPGWSPGDGTQGWNTVKPRYNPIPQQTYDSPGLSYGSPAMHESNQAYQSQQAAQRRMNDTDTGPPPWAGTLRSSGGPKRWDTLAGIGAPPPVTQPGAPTGQVSAGDYNPVVHNPRVQNVHYGPGGTMEYQQHDPDSHQGEAKAVHLQYNSPLGLYSKDNVQDMIDQQTGGKPGEGTIAVTGGAGGKGFNIAESDVYRMIHEQEQPRQRRSARNVNQTGPEMNYQGYVDQTQRSPSMHALEQTVGTSDF